MRDDNSKGTILIVDDIPNNISILFEFLSKHNYRIMVAKDGLSAIKQVLKEKPDLILLDIVMPGIDGYETCRRLKADSNTENIPVIFMSSLYETNDKLKGFQVGAVDYIIKPFQHEEVLARVNSHLVIKNLQKELQETNLNLEHRVIARTQELVETNKKLKQEIADKLKAEEALKNSLDKVERLKNQLQAEKVYLQEEIKLDHNFDEIISQSKIMNNVLNQIEQVSQTDSTVLLTGETGTGKELFARAIHNISNRKEKPLVKVNCAALPSNLIESELFGHEKGAFTGALTKKIGRFELADNGTIFLDEIGDLPLELQSKLLRVLQEGEFERLGNSATMKVNVRVIAATNVNLEEAIKEHKFRQDLYYRLNVFPINIPPLRDRDGDIPILVQHFVKKYSDRMNKTINKIPQELMYALNSYQWLGNVRELENILERAVILSTDTTLTSDLPITNQSDNSNKISLDSISNFVTLKEYEKQYILKALDFCNWKIDGANGTAKLLGLPPSTLRDKIKKHNIKRPNA